MTDTTTEGFEFIEPEKHELQERPAFQTFMDMNKPTFPLTINVQSGHGGTSVALILYADGTISGDAAAVEAEMAKTRGPAGEGSLMMWLVRRALREDAAREDAALTPGGPGGGIRPLQDGPAA